jgi:hypothetical protein
MLQRSRLQVFESGLGPTDLENSRIYLFLSSTVTCSGAFAMISGRP